MKKISDHFSKQATTYKKFRPEYPSGLFDFIYSFCPIKDTAWDCGTGNGQVASILAKSFQKVFATDISKKQIEQAPLSENIYYAVERAERTSFPADYFDLITVAQATHWFDIDAFNKEARRVLKPGGTIAIWAYVLLKIEPEIDKIIDDFYLNTVGAYWDQERNHIDNHYDSIDFRFNEIEVVQKFGIQTRWTLPQLEGYLNSWSSVQNYMVKNRDGNPVTKLMKKLSSVWKTIDKEVYFPIFLRMGNK
jgi:SAM-dependent methyltransferase